MTMKNRALILLAMVTVITVIAIPMYLSINKEYVGGPYPTHSYEVDQGLNSSGKAWVRLADGCYYTQEYHDRWMWRYNCKDPNMDK